MTKEEVVRARSLPLDDESPIHSPFLFPPPCPIRLKDKGEDVVRVEEAGFILFPSFPHPSDQGRR